MHSSPVHTRFTHGLFLPLTHLLSALFPFSNPSLLRPLCKAHRRPHATRQGRQRRRDGLGLPEAAIRKQQPGPWSPLTWVEPGKSLKGAPVQGGPGGREKWLGCFLLRAQAIGHGLTHP